MKIAPRTVQGLLVPSLGIGLALGFAACAGGAAASSTTGPAVGLDEGSYSTGDFTYVSPYPPGFHPLGNDSTVVQELSELVLFDNELQKGGTVGGVLDDPAAGYAPLGNPLQVLPAGTRVLDAACGNVDSDGAAELVLATRQGTSGPLSIQVLEQTSGGMVLVATRVTSFHTPPKIALGDVDGDHRDEILVQDQNSLRIWDDVEDGMMFLDEILHGGIATLGLTSSPSVAVGDVDHDGRGEIVQLQTNIEAGAWLRLLDDADAAVPFADVGGWKKIHTDSAASTGRVFVGDLDGDGGDEVVAVVGEIKGPGYPGLESTLSMLLHVRRFDFAAGVGLQLTATSLQAMAVPFLGALAFPADLTSAWDAVALDTTGDADMEIALLLPDFSSFSQLGGEKVRYEVRTLDWKLGWVAGTPVSLGTFDFDTFDATDQFNETVLCASDADADGAHEVYALLAATQVNQPSKAALRKLDWEPVPAVQVVSPGPLASLIHKTRPILVSGDLDADGVVLQSTGVERLSVADPIPMVLMTAAPTKAGIAQNYDESGTYYQKTTASSQSHGLATATAMSVSAGVGGSLFGTLGASTRRTIERSFETSEVVTKQVATVQGFSSSHEDDVIIFQGTLYHSFEYMVVHAPDASLESTLLTFDFPVDSKTYKWTVAKYDAEFGAAHAIGSDVLPHTIGDPASYRTRAEVDAIVKAHVGWMEDPSITNNVGEGKGHNVTEVEITEAISTSEQLTLTVDDQVDFSTSFAEAGKSEALVDKQLYTISLSNSSTYRGQVGDIEGADYDPWKYDFGIAVWHHGVLADANNEPIGTVPGETPYQVLTFWVEPVGLSY